MPYQEGDRVRDSKARSFRIREADWERIERAAKAAGMTAHAWCVRVLNDAARLA